MTTINGTTANFARNRGLTLETYNPERKFCSEQLWIFGDNDSEPEIILNIGKNGDYHYHSDLLDDKSVKEEIPAYLRDEKHLRELLEFLSKNL